MHYDEVLTAVANNNAYRVKLEDDDQEIDLIMIQDRQYEIHVMECSGIVNGKPCRVKYDLLKTPITELIIPYSYRVFVSD